MDHGAVRVPPDPELPRRADAVRVEPGEAALVAQLFDWCLESRATIYRLAARLTGLGVPTPMGGPRWNTASMRGILRNPGTIACASTCANNLNVSNYSCRIR